MSKALETKLEALEMAVSEQAERVESMLGAAYRGLIERRRGTADEFQAMEVTINESEVAIEDKCLSLLALQQPVAIDLRRVAAVLKINSDLERIGDLSLNLAERIESLAGHPEVVVPPELAEMVKCAIEMLRDANSAFVRGDAALARDVCVRDDALDDMNDRLIHGLIETMASNPENVSGYLHAFSASRIVERIGDHATNIAEDVEYIVKGEITRHQQH